MRRQRAWNGAADADIEDALQNAVLALLQGPPIPPERVLMSLRAAAGLRRRNYWDIRRNRPAGRHVELTDAIADQTVDHTTIDSDPASGPTFGAAALLPYAADCIAELTQLQAEIYARIVDGQREADIAKSLGLDGRRAVQAERYAAEHTIAMFAQVVQAGRICGKRAVAIRDYGEGKASAENVRRAKAHLASCSACAMSFRATQRELGHQVGALLATPALTAAADHVRGGRGLFAHLADIVGFGGGSGGRIDAIRETALGVFVRSPGSTEALTGASLGGAGIAVGAKAVVGLCVVAIAGGGAVCSSIGVLPDGLNIRQPAKERKAEKPKSEPKPAPKKKATTTAAVAPVVTPPVVSSSRTAPVQSSLSSSPAAAEAARKARREQQRARAAKRRATAATTAAVNPLQSSAPTGAPPAATSAASPPPTPPVQAPAAPQQQSAPKSTGTASPALAGATGGFENGAP